MTHMDIIWRWPQFSLAELAQEMVKVEQDSSQAKFQLTASTESVLIGEIN